MLNCLVLYVLCMWGGFKEGRGESPGGRLLRTAFLFGPVHVEGLRGQTSKDQTSLFNC